MMPSSCRSVVQRERYQEALCSVSGCIAAPMSEFPLPEGYLAVSCLDHRREVEGWCRSPVGAPSGARLVAFGSHPPPGKVLRELRTKE